MGYFSTKTYTPGFSCAFRQWRADSHCRFLHGYALEVKITFACKHLDSRNWCMDFGALKPIKAELEEIFDHKTLIAQDDPALSTFEQLDEAELIQLRVVKAVGCEAFAEMIHGIVSEWLLGTKQAGRVLVYEVEVREHIGNAASFINMEGI